MPGTLSLSVACTTIDGDVNGSGTPGVALGVPNGGLASLVVATDHNVIRNLAITGLVLSGPGAHDNRVSGNYIGTDISGRATRGA